MVWGQRWADDSVEPEDVKAAVAKDLVSTGRKAAGDKLRCSDDELRGLVARAAVFEGWCCLRAGVVEDWCFRGLVPVFLRAGVFEGW